MYWKWTVFDMKAKHDLTWITLGEKLTWSYLCSLWASLYVNIHIFAADILMCCVTEYSPASYGTFIIYSIQKISHFHNPQILNSEIYLIPSIWNRDYGTLSRSTPSNLKIEMPLHEWLENYFLQFRKTYRKCEQSLSGKMHVACLLRKTITVIYETRTLRDKKNSGKLC